MTRYGYPLQKRHEDAHAAFLADTRRSLVDLEDAGITPDFRRWAVGRLPEWFRFHILAHDMGLGQFLIKAGAPEVQAAHAASVEEETPPKGDTVIS